ncbi:hypothetical protein [Nisaea sp.]|uniref:hypothetical protein n=1 Tax=Nisaea sp. TaxID=2024842 RepID=UPI00329929C5
MMLCFNLVDLDQEQWDSDFADYINRLPEDVGLRRGLGRSPFNVRRSFSASLAIKTNS